jgi:hypothetical protein
VSFGISPSEVVRQPSSCVRAADRPVFFFGFVSESASEAVGEFAVWATMGREANKASIQTRKVQTTLSVALLWEATIVIMFSCANSTISKIGFYPVLRQPSL